MKRKKLRKSTILCLGSLAAIGITLLSGCAANITAQGMIMQDERVTPIHGSTLMSWAEQFPEHQLSILELPSADKQSTLVGLHLAHQDSKKLIFYIPGNGMQIAEGGVQALSDLSALQHNMVIFDRRGLGASDGQATVQHLIDDAKLQLDYVKRTFAPELLIVHGYSLGGFVAGQLAKESSFDALVLQGTATNAQEWLDLRMPWYYKPFIRVRIDDDIQGLDNKSVLQHSYQGPLLLITGTKDEQVPYQLTESLYSASTSMVKRLIVVPEASHGTMFKKPETIEEYRKFIEHLGMK